MLQLSSGVWAATLAQLRECGNVLRECVVFWTGRLDGTASVDAVVHPVHTATPVHYETDERWLRWFFVGLVREGRTVRAQVHTHGGRASHSPTDDEYPLVRAPGFLSLVVPRFAAGKPRARDLYLAEVGSNGEWHAVRVEERIRGLD